MQFVTLNSLLQEALSRSIERSMLGRIVVTCWQEWQDLPYWRYRQSAFAAPLPDELAKVLVWLAAILVSASKKPRRPIEISKVSPLGWSNAVRLTR